MNRWKLGAGFVLVFAAGALCGAAGLAAYVRSEIRSVVQGGPVKVRAMIVRVLSDRLQLSPEQQRQIEPIVAEGHAEFLKLRARFQPELDDILNKSAEKMRPALSLAQQTELRQLYDIYHKRWRVRDSSGQEP